MLLPDDLILDVHYYHFDTDTKNFIDIVTIYFNKWWRLPKVFKFHRTPMPDPDTGIIYYSSSFEVEELILQLRLWIFDEEIANPESDIKIENVKNSNITKILFPQKSTEENSTEVNDED